MLDGFVALLFMVLAEDEECLGVLITPKSFHLLEQLSSYIILVKNILFRCTSLDLSDLSFFHIPSLVDACDRDFDFIIFSAIVIKCASTRLIPSSPPASSCPPHCLSILGRHFLKTGSVYLKWKIAVYLFWSARVSTIILHCPA